MKTIKVLAFIAIVLSLLSCQQNQLNPKSAYDELVRTDDLECDKENLKVLYVLAELGKFRSSNEQPFSQEDDKNIRSLVEKLKSKTDLFDFARLTMILRRNTSSDECLKSKLEETYNRAFWDCIEILAQDRSKKNLDEMERLKQELIIDSGDSYDWSTIVYRIPQP